MTTDFADYTDYNLRIMIYSDYTDSAVQLLSVKSKNNLPNAPDNAQPKICLIREICGRK